MMSDEETVYRDGLTVIIAALLVGLFVWL